MDLDATKRIQSPAMALQETEAAIHAIEAGDTSQYDAELSEQQASEYAAKLKDQEEGAERTILIIESNPKVQDSLREKLKSLGYRVLITGDPKRGLSRFDDLDPADDLPADCVIFGCVGLGRQGHPGIRRIRRRRTFIKNSCHHPRSREPGKTDQTEMVEGPSIAVDDAVEDETAQACAS